MGLWPHPTSESSVSAFSIQHSVAGRHDRRSITGCELGPDLENERHVSGPQKREPTWLNTLGVQPRRPAF